MYNDTVTNWCQEWNILLAPTKTQVLAISKKPIDKRQAYQTINGHKIIASDQVTFLGVILDSKLTMKKYHEKMMTEAKRRVNMFTKITGTPLHPRASTEVSLAVLRSMIVPVFSYAPTVSCLRTTGQFREQDNLIKKGARMALHCPKTTGGDYVAREAKLKDPKEHCLGVAKRYVMDQARSTSVRELVDTHIKSRFRHWKRLTPLDIILPT